MWKKVWLACILALLMPYIVTLAWTGSAAGDGKALVSESGKKILLDRGTDESYMDLEVYLLGVIAKQIPADYEEEAVRAQAIIARTYLYMLMDEKDEIAESALDLDYMEENQMEAAWGVNSYVAYRKNLENAVRSTTGVAMTYEGEYIEPLFHRASAAWTRAGDEAHPYLQRVESSQDLEMDGYLQVLALDAKAFEGKTIEEIQIISQDESGYVGEVQIDEKRYSGDQIAYALGLQSPCFTLEPYEGKIRAVCKGVGHGYGMSQYGAYRMAKEGKTAEEILNYYYKNIVFVTE